MGVAVERLTMDDLGTLERGERVRKRRGFEPGHTLEHRFPKASTDDRSQLRDTLIAIVQSIETRRNDRPDARGHLGPPVGVVLQQLFEKERVSCAAVEQPLAGFRIRFRSERLQ